VTHRCAQLRSFGAGDSFMRLSSVTVDLLSAPDPGHDATNIRRACLRTNNQRGEGGQEGLADHGNTLLTALPATKSMEDHSPIFSWSAARPGGCACRDSRAPASSSCSACSVPVHGLAWPSVAGRCRGRRSTNFMLPLDLEQRARSTQRRAIP
jgi:hypothetical protein